MFNDLMKGCSHEGITVNRKLDERVVQTRFLVWQGMPNPMTYASDDVSIRRSTDHGSERKCEILINPDPSP